MLIDLIRRQITVFASWKWPGEPNNRVFGHLDDLCADGLAADRLLRRLTRAQRPLLMTHRWAEVRGELQRTWPEAAAWLGQGQLIHIVRHPQHAINSSWPIESARALRLGLPRIDPRIYVQECASRWVENFRVISATPHLLLRYERVLAQPAAAINAVETLTEEQARWRAPLVARPHRSILQSRLARLFAIRPHSTAALPRQAWLRDHQLCWTADLRATLIKEAGEMMMSLGYDPEGNLSSARMADACSPSSISALAPFSP